jgi:hypothetical protein
MRLAEALVDAWNDLATMSRPPGPIDINVGQPQHWLPDTPPARRAVARLMRTTASALRTWGSADGRDGEAVLASAGAAATLDSAVEDWP